jgi:integrase
MYGKGGQVTAKLERLTNTSVKRLAYAKDGTAYIVRDSDLGGFHVRVTSDAKIYKFTTDTVEAGKRRTLGFTLGNAADVQADAARLAAEDLTRQRKLGVLISTRRIISPAPDRLGLTLGAGWQQYRETLIRERKSPKTIKFYQAVMDNHLAHWADTPVKDITRAKVVALHAEISARGHLARANQVVVTGGAIYTYARKGLETPDLPELSPWRSYRLFHKLKARQTGIASGTALAAWWNQAGNLNAVLREANLLGLLTALRLTNLVSLSWDQISAKERYISIDSTKGGAAFRLPLSRAALRCLWRARKASRLLHEVNARKWVFASDRSAAGHISNVKNVQSWKTADGVKHIKIRTEKSAHALRHSWRGFADQARIPATHSKILMNHAVPHDVHSEYLTLDNMFNDLRASAEAVSTLVVNNLSTSADLRKGLM